LNINAAACCAALGHNNSHARAAGHAAVNGSIQNECPWEFPVTERMTGGQAVIRTLAGFGVDTIFGLPGIQLDPLFDALYEQRQSIRTYHTRHEQGAAYMALGYAQASGKVGVFAVVPGPGIMNATAALATAAGSNVPVLGLTGQIPSHQIGKRLGIPHEIRDQETALRGVVPWVELAKTPASAPGLLGSAFGAMLNGRPQPAVFEMAPDILAKADLVSLPESFVTQPRPVPDPAVVRKAMELLATARNPAIFVGSGAMDATEALSRFARRLQAPVIMSRTGKGTISSRHPLAVGMLEGQALWPDVDVAVVVGTRFLAPALSWGRAGEVRIIRIDIDPEQAALPYTADVTLICHADTGLDALLDGLAQRPSVEALVAAVRADVDTKLRTLDQQYQLSRVIREEMPDDGIIVTDVTQLATFVQYGMPVYQPRTLITPGFQGTLGYAYPTALGAKVANPDKKVLSISGDGGFMFNVQELSTAVAHGIDVVAIVMNDAAFGNVKRIQQTNYGGRMIGVDLHNPDFVALANSFGMRAMKAETPDQLRSTLRAAFASPGPALIEMPVGELPSIWGLIRRPPSAG
jgi:acetolactate synthase I/II/III large subunit